VIRQRFGVHGLRLFRLLYLHRQLEQKQIAEQAMLPPKVVPLIHSCPCCLAVSVYKWAVYMGDPACRTCPIASCMLLKNCSKGLCQGLHYMCTLPSCMMRLTIFVGSLAIRLIKEGSLKSAVSCVSQHAGMLLWPQQQAMPAGLHQHHLCYCIWLFAAMPHTSI